MMNGRGDDKVQADRRNILLDVALLMCLVAVVYGRLAGYSFQNVWDDNIYILNNPVSHGFSWDHIRKAFDPVANRSIGQYNPLAMLSFMLDFTLWGGLNPEGYHLTNIVIHGVNGLLVYRLLLSMHGTRLVALVAAALFLLHPVQVESVGWISERKGLLSLCFMLLSLGAYRRYRDAEPATGYGRYALSIALYVLSLMAKSASVVLPVILVLYDICFCPERRRLRLADKVPFAVAAGIFAAIEIYSGQSKTGGATVGYHGGNPFATFLTMLTVFCRYLRLLIWPSGLNVEHLPPVYRTPELPVVGAALLLAGIFYAGWRLFRADRRVGFWFLFFWIGLIPVSQIIPQILMMYEHYLYMPVIGVGALAGYGMTRLRTRAGTRWIPVLYLSAGTWLLALSAVSYQRTAVWRDSLTLFTDATTKSPNGFRVWETLGEVYRYYGNNEASRIALEKSLALKPDSTDVLWGLAQLHTEKRELDKSREYLRRLFRINPEYVLGWATQGDIHLMEGNHDKAREMYLKALALQPDALQVQALLGKLAVIVRDYDEARYRFGVIESDPRRWKLAENAYQLTRTEALSGRAEEALAWLEKALYRGYQDYYLLNTNLELQSLWRLPRFGHLMQQYFPEEERGR